MREKKSMKNLYNLTFCISLFTFAIIDASGEVEQKCEEIRRAIAAKLTTARQEALQNIIARKYDFTPVSSEIEFYLVINKNGLLNAPKSFIQTGTMEVGAAVLDATMDCANLMARRRAVFIGNGLIKNSFVGALTVVEGDFIIESSTFHGDTLIQKEFSSKANSSFVSYTGCLLDHLCVRNNHPVVLELRDTIVTGDIMFDHPGIVVVDKKTMLGGTMSSNVQVMTAKN